MTDYYVSTQGSDANAGTSSLVPFLTWSHANGVVVAGDTVHIMPGAHSGLRVNLSTSGTAAAHITWKADVPGTVFYTLNNGGGGSQVFYISGNYVDIYGLDLTGSTSIAAEGIYYDGNYCSINQCVFHDLYNASSGSGLITGIFVNTGSHDLTINASTFYSMGDGTQSTMTNYVTNRGGNFTMNNCVCYGIKSDMGVDHWEGVDTSQANLSGYTHICNNLIIGGYHNIKVGAAGSVVYDNAIVRNNILVGSTSSPIAESITGGASKRGLNIDYRANCYYLAGTAYDILDVSGNQLNDAYGLHTDPQLNISLSVANNTSTPPVLRQAWTAGGQGSGTGVANLSATPDFHLSSGSPCIDAGWYNSTAYPTDRDAVARAYGGIDIGPYEYQQVINEPVVTVYDPGLGQISQLQNTNCFYNTISISTLQPLNFYPAGYLSSVLQTSASNAEVPWIGQVSVEDSSDNALPNAYCSIRATVSGPFLMGSTPIVQQYTQRFQREDGSMLVASAGVYQITYPIHFTTGQTNVYIETWVFSDLCGNQDIIIVSNAVGA